MKSIAFSSQKLLVSVLLSLVLLVSACGSQPPSRWDSAQQQSTQKTQVQTNKTNNSKATSGGSFNKFFPSASGGFQRVYTQEKTGFAEAKLKKNGQDVAVMSISDTTTNPSATTKFKQSSQKISGYPAVSQGSNGTAILVGKYQVKVQSRNPSFSQSDRETWLQKFDLNGLSRLR
ncbi:hypothetical protein [Merismopedia glauca]|uniref:Uncharacterized protein n=1 Tax=Merismopedia glauca CCAP 1448/3 TaxID=1296344 RepID=A0A2T1BYC6_9CYAN|nr:hypothetical protein [Merismopedia glauca]PSB01011.1 hypothetical protein C7B64_20570 [Merismopedia glauca CCAP 1448/3]